MIRLEHIDFAYTKNQPILKDININVPKGAVYGFLGVNGAGKSTTLRLIMGLMKPTNGEVFLFDEPIKKTYPNHLKRVGSLIESPPLYHHLSARDNLKIWCNYFNVSKNKIKEILHLTRLEDVNKKKVGNFSTGMKQRLGLATALLQDPEILILDEPTNGLDPVGIMELRQIISDLNTKGTTILLSSHILAEVEKMVNYIGIIKNGSIAFEGTIESLKALRQQNVVVKFRVDNIGDSVKILVGLDIANITEDTFQMALSHEEELPHIIKRLVQGNVQIFEVSPIGNSLEELFINLSNV